MCFDPLHHARATLAFDNDPRRRSMRALYPVTAVVVGFAVPEVARAFSDYETQAEVVRLAYLDPGSGSFVVQALIAMFAGIVVTSRMYWSKIKSFFGMASSAADDGYDPEDEDEDDV